MPPAAQGDRGNDTSTGTRSLAKSRSQPGRGLDDPAEGRFSTGADRNRARWTRLAERFEPDFGWPAGEAPKRTEGLYDLVQYPRGVLLTKRGGC